MRVLVHKSIIAADLYDVIHCVHMGRHGMAWHAAHLADSVAFSQTNNGNASFGKEQEGIGGWIVCIDSCVFFPLFLVVQLFHITAHYASCMPASQPASLT